MRGGIKAIVMMNKTKVKPTEPHTPGVTPLRSFLTLVLLSIIWGSSYILIKKALIVFDPLQLGALRLSISALAFLPFLTYQLRRIDWRKWPFLLIVGLTGTGLPSLLFPLAQQGISSSLAGILNSLTPLFTLLLGILIFRIRLIWAKVAGVVIGLGGATLLVLRGTGEALSGSAGYALLAIAGSLCYAVSSNTVATYLRSVSSLLISAASFCMVGIPAALYLFGATDFVTILTTHPQGWLGLGYVAFLALFSTVLASIIFFQLVQWTTALFSSTVSYIVPLVALSWGLFDGEAIGWVHLVGMGMILSGVYLSRK
jgi:drug/metabolite transporter (DMT)-like permease